MELSQLHVADAWHWKVRPILSNSPRKSVNSFAYIRVLVSNAFYVAFPRCMVLILHATELPLIADREGAVD